MMDPLDERLRLAVETFWESFPPFWHRVRSHIRQMATEQYDISVEQFHILRHMRRGESSVSELAEAKHISRPAISQAVNALADKELITRTRNPDDRREVRLALTGAGEALMDAIFDETRRWMMQMLSPLEEDELQTLVQAMSSLRKIQDN